MLFHKTTMKPDGTFETVETVGPAPVGDPFFDRVSKVAEANPGQIIVGAKATEKGVQPDAEIIDSLDNL